MINVVNVLLFMQTLLDILIVILNRHMNHVVLKFAFLFSERFKVEIIVWRFEDIKIVTIF